MSKQILFVQGAGNGAHEIDKELVDSLQTALGTAYEVVYPAMPNEDDPDLDAWKQRIEKEIATMEEPVGIVSHSVGGSILLKSLEKSTIAKSVAGIFLLATPYWGGEGWRYEGYEKLELSKAIEAQLPNDAPIFLYHCQDDSTVPYEHLTLYTQLLPHAIKRSMNQGGHQFNNDLSIVAKDIAALF